MGVLGSAAGPTGVLTDEWAARLSASGRMTDGLAALTGRAPPTSRYPGTKSAAERLGALGKKGNDE